METEKDTQMKAPHFIYEVALKTDQRGYQPGERGIAWWRVPAQTKHQVIDYECDGPRGGSWRLRHFIVDGVSSDRPEDMMTDDVDACVRAPGVQGNEVCFSIMGPGALGMLLFERTDSNGDRAPLPFRAAVKVRSDQIATVGG